MELIENHSAGIYQIRNKVNGKVYDGQAKDLYERNYIELKQLKGGYFHNTHLQHSWDKYGAENFELIILVDNCDESELDDLEIANILFHDAMDPDFGYNKTEGGHGGLSGYEHSDETKKQQSKSAIKRYEDPNERLKTSESAVKRYEDPNERLKTSKALKGKKKSDEHKEKMKGPRPNTQGENHHYYGKHRIQETKNKISKALTGKKFSKERCENISKITKGEGNPNCKITECDARQIKILCATTNMTHQLIADCIPRATKAIVDNISSGNAWKDLVI